jgi:hypothetical protein
MHHKPSREQQRTTTDDEPEPTSEEDLQAKDASAIPREPQNPVNPDPEPAS